MTYKQRVKNFWEWFSENEEKLAEMIQNIKEYDAQDIITPLSEGLNIAIEDCVFETGGSLEINLSANGSIPMIMLTYYLVKNMPEKYIGKWTFTPWKQSMPQMALQIGDTRMSAADILVDVNYNEGKFNLEFYNGTLAGMDENQAYHIFFLVLDLTLGENISIGFTGAVHKAENQADSMISLSELLGHIQKTLEENEREIPEDYNPSSNYFAYSMTPDEDAGMELDPRFDIIAGFTRMNALLNDFYDNESTTFDMFEENGAKAAYITIARTDEDHNADLDIRNEITDKIEEALGLDGSGEELGAVAGQAIGINNTYIDLLLYDEFAFMEKLIEILDDYSLEISVYDFKRDAEKKALRLPR